MKTAQASGADERSEWPTVSIIIPVHNERVNAEKKVKNLQNLSYPRERLEIIFISDGSTDDTNDYLEQLSDIKFLSYPKRQGKPTALNKAVSQAKSEIIVFTDVRQELDSMAVKHLVDSLLQDNIGAVSGELSHKSSATETGKNVGLYWRYEKWIRKSESMFYSTAGVTGALYAIRKADYEILRPETLLDDFEVPMKILAKGKRVILDPNAKLFDVSQEDIEGEKKRKIRTLTGNYQSFLWNPWLFIPWKNPIFFQFVSHKVFRLIVPYALVSVFITSIFSSGWIYEMFLFLQSTFYLLGILGIFSKSINSNKLVSFIVVFIQLNISAVIALKIYLLNQVQVTWEKA